VRTKRKEWVSPLFFEKLLSSSSLPERVYHNREDVTTTSLASQCFPQQPQSLVSIDFFFIWGKLLIVQEETAVAVRGAKQVSSSEKYKSVVGVKLRKSYILK